MYDPYEREIDALERELERDDLTEDVRDEIYRHISAIERECQVQRVDIDSEPRSPAQGGRPAPVDGSGDRAGGSEQSTSAVHSPAAWGLAAAYFGAGCRT